MTIVGRSAVAASEFGSAVDAAVRGSGRLACLFALPEDGGHRVVAVVAGGRELSTVSTLLAPGVGAFASITSLLPSADWYEREIHDLFGLEATGHPDLDPLVLARAPASVPPRPSSGAPVGVVEPSIDPLPPLVRGEGMFTIPYGPVRSGVFEAIEYVVETPGEDIPRVRTRVHYKHRGVEQGFYAMTPADGALRAERVEGVATVAHALAYCGALERLAGARVAEPATLVRVLHAELERIANHLDSTLRNAEAAGQAVAFARVGVHKERVQRLRADLCGSRFGRGVVVPGGVGAGWPTDVRALAAVIDELASSCRADLDLLMRTPSFLDRLRGTGVLTHEVAAAHGAIGPIGRGSGLGEDVRASRPYDGYGELDLAPSVETGGDALARQRVRCDEIESSFRLLSDALRALAHDVRIPPAEVAVDDGDAFGWAEAPQGELLYYVAIEGGRLRRVKVRSASFHNLGLFTAAFPKDITTDFAFIEASFGISVAGVSG